MANDNSRLIFSTETGRMCPNCGKPLKKCACKEKRIYKDRFLEGHNTVATKSDNPTLRTAARYFMLQLPGQVFLILILLLFREWMEIPGYLMWGLPSLWILKDVLLFPVLWRYYAVDKNPDPSRMIGRRGSTLSRLAPDGHVHVQGERWRASVAEGSPPIEKGKAVRVRARKGLRLIVSERDEEQRQERLG